MKKNITLSTAVFACIITFALTVSIGFLALEFLFQRQSIISDAKQASSSASVNDNTDILFDVNDLKDYLSAYDSLNAGLRYAAFSNSGFESTDIIFDVNDLKNYVSKYDQFNSHTYYNSLNESERLVYHIFEYALDHSYCDIYISTSIFSGCNYSVKQILDMYSLDTPVVEQNIQFTAIQPLSQFIDTTVIDTTTKVEIEGKCYHVPCFEETKLQRKDEAIQKAKDICTLFSKQESDYDKTKAIFEYLVDHITYEKLGEKKWYDADYLYDALCVGATNCDGYANAFSLLANLCGINNFEKKYYPSDGGEGHTWNCVCIDGIWYNVDATHASSNVAKNNTEKISEMDEVYKVAYYYFWFCVSDSRKGVAALYNELLPSCNHNMLESDIEILCDYEDVDVIPLIASVFNQTKNPYIIIITSFEIDQDDRNRLAEMSVPFYGRTFEVNGQRIYSLTPKNEDGI